ncbi:MAG TPA: arginine deiminase family protein [Vicinamibacterales bacterium]|nr:arginine deiminase family protein [Vicinamibacterales bacterium]
MSTRVFGELSETGRIGRMIVKHPADAFRDADTIEAQWQDLNFTAAPDLERAIEEYEHFLALITSQGAEVLRLPPRDDVAIDSIYTRDATLVTPHGLVCCRMGKRQRQTEPGAQADACRGWGVPVIGEIVAPGLIEGGDVVWLDDRTVVAGRGYRTNDEGIAQFREILGGAIDELITVPLPHHRGPGDVFHLMSIISPVDRDLAVVYSPLMPVPFRERLLSRGIALVEVPDDEFDSMGANVLAIAPRHCVMLAGNPRTRARLEVHGAHVLEYEGAEISLKGGGGPTCLTRPLSRGSNWGQTPGGLTPV